MRAKDEELAEGDALFNCDDCLFADAMAHLHEDSENAQAWDLFHRITCRFSHDLAAGGVMLQRLTADLDPIDFADTCARLRLLYDTLCPPPEQKNAQE